MGRHGRATMPFGKYKGVRIRLIPDDYLSWLTTTEILNEDRWRWLKESLLAELKFRGMHLAATKEKQLTLPILQVNQKRKIELDES